MQMMWPSVFHVCALAVLLATTVGLVGAQHVVSKPAARYESAPLSVPAPDFGTHLPPSNVITSTEATSHRPFLKFTRHLQNMTRENGADALMKCEVSGVPHPVVSWYRNEAPLEQVRNRIEIRYQNGTRNRVVSRLRIYRLDVHDMGFYKCEATNGFTTLETIGILRVEGGERLLMRLQKVFKKFTPLTLSRFFTSRPILVVASLAEL